MTVREVSGGASELEAAAIWAAAAAERDGLDTVPAAEVKLPGIRRSTARLMAAARDGGLSRLAVGDEVVVS